MNQLERFGINNELLAMHGIHEPDFKSPVSVNELSSTLQKIVPQHGGHELIRVGGPYDGGYLIPNDLKGIEACFSPGVSDFKDFEDQIADQFSIKSYLCDFSTDPSRLKTPLIAGLQFFDRKWLDIDGAENSHDLDDWVAANVPTSAELLLQMDIEGAEYRNLLHISDATLSRFRVIVLELHGLGSLADPAFLRGVFNPVIERLNRVFQVVHAHPNNNGPVFRFASNILIPKLLELTLLRRDRLRSHQTKLVIPHRLDEVNVLHKPPLHLEGFWLQHADAEASSRSALIHSKRYFESAYNKLIEENKPCSRCSLDWETTKVVLCRPQGGLNDMLCQIEKCCRYAEQTGRYVAVDTNYIHTNGFHDDFSRYFVSRQPGLLLSLQRVPQTYWNRSVFPESVRNQLFSYKVSSKKYDINGFTATRCLNECDSILSFDFNKNYSHDILLHHQCGGGDDSLYALLRLRLKKELHQQLSQRLAVIGVAYSALHVRNTDYASNYHSAVLEWLRNNPGPYFLATDSQQVLDFARSHAPTGQLFNFSSALSQDGTPIHHHIMDSDAAYSRNRDAILDLLMLALARRLQCVRIANKPNGRASYAGFSRLAMNLHRNRSVLMSFLDSAVPERYLLWSINR